MDSDWTYSNNPELNPVDKINIVVTNSPEDCKKKGKKKQKQKNPL